METRPVSITAIVLTLFVWAGADTPSSITTSPSWEKLKLLTGAWTGTTTEDGKPRSTTVSFKVVSDGSAIMSTLGEGTPYEMVTMFHTDGKELLATHYCSAHNQPRMQAVASTDPNRIVFKFKDATNVGPNDGHMVQLAIVFDGQNHHLEEWTYEDKGKQETSLFDFRRKN
jgi:hypothetical protein